MSRIILEADALAKLRGATQAAEIADESGNVIGSFVPNDEFERGMAALLPPLSREEIAEARAEMLAHGGVSTADILAAIDDAKRRWEATR